MIALIMGDVPLGQIVNLWPQSSKNRRARFSRSELNQLLALYTSRVMAGEWRDYAINVEGTVAEFCVFRSACETPEFTIAKVDENLRTRQFHGRKGQFVVLKGREKVKQSHSLLDVLTVFDRKLRSV